MKEIFLLKLGEIVLKGANKRQFEARLRQNVRRRMRFYGNFDVYLMQSTVYVEPMDDQCDVDGAWEACRSIFGVVSLCRCRACEKNLDAIFAAIEEYLGDDLDCAKSFKVESKRSDKAFPMGSIQISQEIGGRLAEAHPNVAVDVHHPDYTVFVEVRDLAAYVHGPAEALTSIYASPDLVNLRTFLDGLQSEHGITLTQEERDLLSLPEGDVFRYSADEVEAYLNTYFGIGIQDLQDSALANLTYQESTNSYYYATSGCDGEVPMFHAYHLEALPDGTLLMYYTTGGWPAPNMVAKLQPTEEGYIILSNLRL